MNPYIEEVHPSQLRRAMSAYNAAGVDVRGYRRLETGMMAIIIMLPEGDEAPDWRGVQPKRRPRRLPAFNWRRWVSILCVLAIIGAVGYIVYGAAMGGGAPTLAGVPVEVGGMKLDPVTGRGVQESWLDWLPSISPPWADAAQPEQPQVDGFQWPWDAAAENARAAAETVQGTVTLAAGSIVAVLALLIVLALARRRG